MGGAPLRPAVAQLDGVEVGLRSVTSGNSESVAELFYEARRALGLSQAALGESVGVAQQTIAKWENSEMDPPPERWAAIETALELPVGTIARHYGVAPPAASKELIRELEREARDLRQEADRAIRRADQAAERLARLRGGDES